jgi:hypothetical protein
MINSLRLVGHDEPIYLLYCGLTDAQRELLEPEATLVPGPAGSPPWLLKTIAPRRHPAETMVLIDTDVIVTRSLHDQIAAAAPGRVVGYETGMDRFCAEWGELLDLGTASPRPYVVSGLVFLGGALGGEILELLHEGQRKVDFGQTYWPKQQFTDYPFLFADQDVLNAILATRVAPDRIVALDQRLCAMPFFEGFELVDRESLRCVYADGTEAHALHHIWPAKPWFGRISNALYPRLMQRLLSEPDVAVTVPKRDLPLGLRRGPLAYAARQRVSIPQLLRWRVGSLADRLRLGTSRRSV